MATPADARRPTRAYATFLADQENIQGVVGLARGLRKVATQYPLVVAVLPPVPEDHRRILVSLGCIVREIQPLRPTAAAQTQFAMPRPVVDYSKLRIWEFDEYSKIIFLDGDVRVLDNIDHLFELQDGHLHAVMDCSCETWSHFPHYNTSCCQYCPDEVQRPAQLGPHPAFYFNAGMFVFEPDPSTYHSLVEKINAGYISPFAEQDVLNMFFKDKYIPIPPIYNLVISLLSHHPETIDLERVKVVRFCAAGCKPWSFEEENMDRQDVKMLVKKWRDIYNDAADAPQPFWAPLFRAARCFWGLLGGEME